MLKCSCRAGFHPDAAKGVVYDLPLLPLTGELLDEVQDRLVRLGYETLETWAGVENYEERMVDDCIDPVVLEKLREATS